jgi:hypothetical protein
MISLKELHPYDSELINIKPSLLKIKVHQWSHSSMGNPWERDLLAKTSMNFQKFPLSSPT